MIDYKNITTVHIVMEYELCDDGSYIVGVYRTEAGAKKKIERLKMRNFLDKNSASFYMIIPKQLK